VEEAIRTFFKTYEAANAAGDVSAISDLYANNFIFGGPKGSQMVKREDFVKAIPKRKQYFQSMGLGATKLSTFSWSQLDPFYIQVRTQWEMIVQSAQAANSLLTEATYVIETRSDSLKILLQIDHQDLGAKVQALSMAG
jgi:hypothetical protein